MADFSCVPSKNFQVLTHCAWGSGPEGGQEKIDFSENWFVGFICPNFQTARVFFKSDPV